MRHHRRKPKQKRTISTASLLWIHGDAGAGPSKRESWDLVPLLVGSGGRLHREIQRALKTKTLPIEPHVANDESHVGAGVSRIGAGMVITIQTIERSRHSGMESAGRC